jgi:lambda family phage portal protein
MKLFSTVKSWWSGLFKKDDPQARFEGAITPLDEPAIPSSWQDAEFDGTPGVRIRMAADARHWEQSSALINRIADLFEEFTVGPAGLRLIPNPGNNDDDDDDTPDESVEAWKRVAKKKWNKWCEHPEVDSNRGFAESQALMARNWMISGEIFIKKVYAKNDTGKKQPYIQLIESHRVETPNSLSGNIVGSAIHDGIELDDNGIIQAYWVRKTSNAVIPPWGNSYFSFSYSAYTAAVEWERIPADEMLHLYEAGRPQYRRGLTMLYPVLRDQSDLQLLQKLEVDTAKALSELALVYITKTGELPKANGASAVRRARSATTTDAATNAVVQSEPVFHSLSHKGGKRISLNPGEDIKSIDVDRPTTTQQWLWEYLIWKICAGTGISRLVVAPQAPAQGTLVRSDLDVQSRFFLSRSMIIQKLWIEIYRFYMGWAKDFDRDLKGAPADWDAVKVRAPKSICVDLGRNSQAAIAEIAAGLRTRADWFAENGEDWEEQMMQCGKEYAKAKTISAQTGAPVEYLLGIVNKNPAQPAPDDSSDDAGPRPPLVPDKSANGFFHRHRLQLRV